MIFVPPAQQPPHLQQTRFTTQHEHFQKQRLQMLQMPRPKFGDAPKVRDILAHDDAKGRVGDASLHDLPRGKHARAVSIEQQNEHHSRMKRRLPAVVAAVVLNDRRKIDLSGHIQQKVNQMIFRQPVPRRRRKQPPRIRLPFPKLTTHPCPTQQLKKNVLPTPTLIQHRPSKIQAGTGIRTGC